MFHELHEMHALHVCVCAPVYSLTYEHTHTHTHTHIVESHKPLGSGILLKVMTLDQWGFQVQVVKKQLASARDIRDAG